MATSTSTSVVKTFIILNSQDDQDEWIEVIKTASITRKVQEYINPDTIQDDLPILDELLEPTYSQVVDSSQQDIKYSELNKDEKEEFKRLQQQFKQEQEIYMKKDAAIATIRTRIQESVSRTNLGYTFNCNTPYNMLVKLKEQFSPTTTTRTHKVLL